MMQHPLTRLAPLATLSPRGRGDPTEIDVCSSPRPAGERVAAQRPGEGRYNG